MAKPDDEAAIGDAYGMALLAYGHPDGRAGPHSPSGYRSRWRILINVARHPDGHPDGELDGGLDCGRHLAIRGWQARAPLAICMALIMSAVE